MILAIDAQIVGMSLLELNGFGIAMVGGVDLQLWAAVHQMPVCHMVLLTGTTFTTTISRHQGRTKGRLGNLCHHFDMKTVLWQIMDISPTETNHLSKGN